VEDSDRLGLFVQKARELADTRLLRSGFQSTFSINWDRVAGTTFGLSEVDEDDLRSCLLSLRQFVAPGESINLLAIYNVCQRRLRSDHLKAQLIAARQAWKKCQYDIGMKIVFDDGEWSPELVADLWINGHYFHSDSNKRLRLTALIPVQTMLARQVFLAYISDAIRTTMFTANVVDVGLRDGLFVS
jgi:hypothetical protein